MSEDEIKQRLEKLESSNGVLSHAVADMKDSLVVLAAIQKRQSEVQEDAGRGIRRGP